jgi:dTDP-glucose 4,6-dehydratase
MKYFVTGGLGFIGSAVVRLAIEEGHSVLNVDSQTYAANTRNVESVADNPNYSFAKADICDEVAMQKLIADFQPDCIIHLAAESHVDRSIDGPGTFIKTNINGTFVLLEAARKHNIRFLHVSTDEVYGSIETGAFTPDSPYQPNSPYSASKAGSDMLARAWFHTYGLPTMISNCSNNYGMCQFPEKLIPTVIQNALSGNPIPVYGDGKNVRDWLYVEDHARALLLIASKGQPGETYTIGGNCDVPNIELIHMICDI